MLVIWCRCSCWLLESGREAKRRIISSPSIPQISVVMVLRSSANFGIFPFFRVTACTARQRLCYGRGVRLSVRLSVTLLYCVKTTQLRIMKSSLWATARTLVFLWQIFVPLGEGIPLERGRQTRAPPVKSRHFTAIGLNPKNMGFKWIFCYFRLRRTLRVNFRWNILEIDQDSLRTKLNWCCRASREH